MTGTMPQRTKGFLREGCPTDDKGLSTRRRHSADSAVVISVLAAGGVVAGATESHAIPIYSGVQDIDVAINSSFLLDINDDGTDDLKFTNIATLSKNNNYDELDVLVAGLDAAYRVNSEEEPAALPAGFVIDPAFDKLVSPHQYTEESMVVGDKDTRPWYGSNRHYLGVIWWDGLGLKDWRAGWVQMSVSAATYPNNPFAVTIHDWAYESELNVPIVAGDTGPGPVPIPEPNSLSLLALGAAGLMAFRRARRRQIAGRQSGA